MEKFTGPEDVYKELVTDVPQDEEWLFGLVAFAVIEEKKIEWLKHQRENNGGTPTDDEIRSWYQQLPSGEILRARDTAEARLINFGEIAIAAYLEDYEIELRDSILVGEIRDTKRFLPQFAVNLAGGIASAVIFSVLIAVVAFIVLNDTSPVEIIKELKETTGVIENGKEGSN